MPLAAPHRVSVHVLVLFLATACGASPAAPEVARPPPAVSAPRLPAPVPSASPSVRVPDPSPPVPERCPDDMVYIEHDFCPRMQRRCVRSEYSKANHITICHEFARGEQECLSPREPRAFCIDRYEFPNQAGGHPPVMIDWYEAMGLCAARDRRLCYESEWVAACEGPDETPFPYGWQRSSEQCNIDNPWINPSLARAYSTDPAVREAELARLDQSVPSGARSGCVSGYGVYDLTGNFDEWAMADHDRPQTKADFAALKGGAWGHVRNACRPVTTSHNPSFSYYFITARCCRDPAPPGDSAPSPD